MHTTGCGDENANGFNKEVFVLEAKGPEKEGHSSSAKYEVVLVKMLPKSKSTLRWNSLVNEKRKGEEE